MDPSLIDTTLRPDLPAPLWFIEFFKVLGFALHAVPMNLWYAGILVAMLLRVGGSEPARRFAARLMTQMPVILAYGINLGVVPLLFVQVAYYRVFYPATILMAWGWLAIVLLLIPAYYGVYVYSFGLREGARMGLLRQAAGWGAAVLLIAIGFLFANGWSLMTHVSGWQGLWERHSTAAAALGTGLNLADPTLWPRWAMMFGLALTTTAAWAVVDAGWFARRESPQYRRWAAGFSWKLYLAGMIAFAAAGSWYVFGTWADHVQGEMFAWPLLILTALTALAPGLPWLLLVILAGPRRVVGAAVALPHPESRGDTTTVAPTRQDGPGRAAAALLGLAQLGVLGLNAVSRQVVQNLELQPHWNPLSQQASVEWGPLVMFLAAFVLGASVVAWMIRQAAKCPS